MCRIISLVVWTTSGTFMLMFLAALQNVPVELEEAGADRRRDAAGSGSGTSPCRCCKPDHVPGAHARPDRHLAGLRPDLRDEPGQPGEDHADAGLPVLPDGVPRLRVRRRRGDLVPALPDHRRADAPTAVAHAGQDEADGRRRPSRARPMRPGAPAQERPARGSSTAFVGYAILIFFGAGLPLPVRHPARQRRSRPRPTRPPTRCRRSPTRSPPTASRASSTGTDFPLWLGNSVVVTIIVTVGRVFLDSLAGYALARLRFRGRAAIFAAIVGADGRARRRAADPEVPGAQPARHLRQLRRR